MTDTLEKNDVTVTFPYLSLTGQLVHDRAAGVLELMTDEGPERLSVNLDVYGLSTATGEVWIKDWSEHEGLTGNLAEQGLVEVVSTAHVGPFASRAHLVRVLFD